MFIMVSVSWFISKSKRTIRTVRRKLRRKLSGRLISLRSSLGGGMYTDLVGLAGTLSSIGM